MLTITGLAVNIGSEVIEAQVRGLDASGNALAAYPPANFNAGNLSIAGFTLEFPGINQWRAATQASLTLLDGRGSRSSTLTTGILKGDSGGPNLSSMSFNGSVLNIKGKRLNGQLGLEVNGAVVAISNVTVKGSGKKARVEATAVELQLNSGPNRVRVISDGLRSNALILDL